MTPKTFAIVRLARAFEAREQWQRNFNARANKQLVAQQSARSCSLLPVKPRALLDIVQ